MANETDIIIIDPCPACGGRHALSGQDQVDYICKGSFNKPKKEYFNQLKNNLTDENWNNVRETAEDVRKETTIVGFKPNKQKGRLYSEGTYKEVS